MKSLTIYSYRLCERMPCIVERNSAAVVCSYFCYNSVLNIESHKFSHVRFVEHSATRLSVVLVLVCMPINTVWDLQVLKIVNEHL
jgi:hypothetical protein